MTIELGVKPVLTVFAVLVFVQAVDPGVLWIKRSFTAGLGAAAVLIAFIVVFVLWHC